MRHEKEFIEEMVLVAVNQGDFYPNDPEGSADAAFESWVRDLKRCWRDYYRAEVTQEVTASWAPEDTE